VKKKRADQGHLGGRILPSSGEEERATTEGKKKGGNIAYHISDSHFSSGKVLKKNLGAGKKPVWTKKKGATGEGLSNFDGS